MPIIYQAKIINLNEVIGKGVDNFNSWTFKSLVSTLLIMIKNIITISACTAGDFETIKQIYYKNCLKVKVEKTWIQIHDTNETSNPFHSPPLFKQTPYFNHSKIGET